MLNKILTKNEIKKANCMEKSQNQLADQGPYIKQVGGGAGGFFGGPWNNLGIY